MNLFGWKFRNDRTREGAAILSGAQSEAKEGEQASSHACCGGHGHEKGETSTNQADCCGGKGAHGADRHDHTCCSGKGKDD